MSLLHRIEKHLKATNMPAATFGRAVMRDPRFVFDLRNKGREPRSKTVAIVQAYLDGQGAA